MDFHPLTPTVPLFVILSYIICGLYQSQTAKINQLSDLFDNLHQIIKNKLQKDKAPLRPFIIYEVIKVLFYITMYQKQGLHK